jgi:hypothetical protein
MRLILTSVCCLVTVLAFAAPPPQGGGAPKNLKVLKPEDVRAAMGTATHAQGDFASDENPKKVIARHMFEITADVNAKFPDGKEHVTCYTCHRGAATPLTAPPAGAPAEKKQ